MSSALPLVQGGARFIADWLDVKLREHGHDVETLHIPTSICSPRPMPSA
jgi:hypothetical protein